MSGRPEVHEDAAVLAQRIVEATGGDIVLGLPIGIGKPNHLVNALYALAQDDESISLRIFTALTLELPAGKNELQRRFIEPLVERLFAGIPALDYATDLRRNALPPNVQVNEFFLLAGKWLGHPGVQQSYTSANYAHGANCLRQTGFNVWAQLVAEDGSGDGQRLSLGGNTDITLDILDAMRFRGGRCLFVGQLNSELPFMPGPAALPAESFDYLLAGEANDYPLFPLVNKPLDDAQHAIGIRAAALVPDGGSIQIGIGSIGDAFGAGLLMRHQEPELFREILERLGGGPEGDLAHTGSFAKGLYGISEMFVPAFLPLYEGGVLKRRAADGALLHGGFFVGPKAFYQRLREMPEAERAAFQMREISFVNTLYGDEAGKRQDRVDARFINNAMLVTALGAVTSDALEDGRVISGVGGQHDMVAQAFALDGARAVIALKSTRRQEGRLTSNVVWSYGNTTIPRHLRDIIVTEYGVADLRYRSDRDCVRAMLRLTDSRFQSGLIEKAQAAAKLEPDFRLAEDAPVNEPGRISEALAPAHEAGWCRTFPFGTGFTEEEQKLLPALQRLKEVAQRPPLFGAAAAAAAFTGSAEPDELPLLKRLDLDAPEGLRERALQRAVLWALRDVANGH